jgi:chromosome partitioning protein
VPKGIERLFIDGPAAMKGKEVEELIRETDLIVLPLLPGRSDEQATALVGNRLRPRTKAAERLDLFLSGVGHRVVTRLRDSQLYVAAAASG